MSDVPTSSSSALQEALAGLPAKPRVHELARRAGMSSKEIIAALAERGTTVGSASSGIDLATATALLTALIAGEAAADVPVATPSEPEPTEATPAPVADLPLFLPPQSPPPRRRRKTTTPDAGAPAAVEGAATTEQATVDEAPAAADAEAPAEAGTAPASGGRSRRRGGRGRAAAQAADQIEAPQEPAAAAPVAAPAAPEATSGDNASTDEPDGTDNDDTADGAGARKRRRRGRRGRGRVQDAPDAEDETAPDAEGAGESGPDATTPGDGQPDAGEPDADTADAEADADHGTDDQAGPGSRRRRRRRRRGGGADAADGKADDPDNTVVHVREPRKETPVADEVQGIRGSTRLEAKRQRRREGRGAARRPAILTEAEFLARREAVNRVMAVRQRGDLAQVALLEDDVLVEHFVSRAGTASMIGNVYLGKVQNVLPSMEAAFVDIGRGRNAVLYAGEVNWDASGLVGKTRRIEAALSSGDTVLVQVSKDPVGHKGARLTTQISLPGRFLVYVPGGGATGISRKLPDTERKRLKAILDRIVPGDAGVIIRTAAEGVPEEELQRDVERLQQQWSEISKAAEKVGTAPKQLSTEPDTLIKVIRDLFNSDINRLVVDGDDAWEAIDSYVGGVAPELADRVSRYEGPGDVFGRYRIDEQIAKALERKVHLPSGGSLVIDRTEAMTVVDVNTGKYTGSGGNLEETVTRNNLEAAEEIVRQLRLRDIGGIIVVDFIDMVLESNRDLVLRRLTECLGRDRTRHQVAEVTSLGLVQMTRKRLGTGLVEAFSEPCPHCGGRGIVLHDVPVDAGRPDDDEPRSSRGRRNRGRRGGDDNGARDGGGREAAREPDVPIVAVVTGARPDPRGPKGPVRGGQQAGQDAGRLTPEEAAEVALAALAAGPGEVAADPTEVTVEAALEADETVGLPSGEPTEDIAAEAAEAVAAVTEPEPEKPKTRRRRAAGRPAGAPNAASVAVDMVLPAVPAEAPVVPAESTVIPADAGISPADEAVIPAEEAVIPADAGISPPPAAAAARPRRRASRSTKASSDQPAEPATVADPTGGVDSAPVKKAAPRRRRAATRPSGPAGEPVTVVGAPPS